MDEYLLNALAVRMLEVWLLSLGFQPSGGWDETDPNCRREVGPHTLWCVQATVPNDVDMEAVRQSFYEYIKNHNSLPGAVKFQPYNLELYVCDYSDGERATHLFATVYR